ncbi:MAG: hypothetical protein K2W82_02395 [Candidatus Obscuribacterales bacterium]|nr:hypothetical protein [Candidatus Obscuribacterales bacterium]
MEITLSAKVKILQAIKQLGRKVSAADVAAAAALPLAQTRIELNKVAFETLGKLEVSKSGEILYSFPSDFEAVYNASGVRKFLQMILAKVSAALFYCLRISFGILLIASFITISLVFIVALVFIIFGIGASEGADGDMDGFELDADFFDWQELLIFFSWSVFTGGETQAERPVEYLGMQVEQPNQGFFSNCFSFLFGDGDPNKKTSDLQWQNIAQLIRLCNGVVTAEQLAPYLLSAKMNDHAVFPVLVRFEGIPEVTDGGRIVYTFPSLQITAADYSRLIKLPENLQEEFWKFSKLPLERLQWVFFFAGANLCGAYALWKHIDWFQPLMPYAEQVKLGLIYAIFFMGFPILRQIVNNMRNVFIDARNRIRAKRAEELMNAENQKAIVEAQEYAQKLTVLTKEQVAYSTDKDLLEQELDQL